MFDILSGFYSAFELVYIQQNLRQLTNRVNFIFG